MIRKPLVSGQFYASNFQELDKEINECFNSKFGPAALPIKKREKNLISVVAPHAGYAFSGPCQAWSYKEIGEARFPDLFILLGLSHSGFKTCLSLYDFETPFGIVKNDIEFGRALIKNSNIPENEDSHKLEHSIEVQLPFLQFVSRDYLGKLRICPIICSPDIDYKEISEGIYKTLKEQGKKAIVIASSDFTHYGINYGYFPFKENVKENLYELDKNAIKFIEKLDEEGFLNYINEKQTTICGYYPIATMLNLAKKLGAKKGKMLIYYTSGDVINDYSSAVGYASIKIE